MGRKKSKTSIVQQSFINRERHVNVRSCVIDDDKANKILRALRVGATLTVAAMSARIKPELLFDWLKKGDEGDPDYVEFYYAVMDAKSDHVLVCLERIHEAQEEDWRASAWSLERLYPDQYGKKIESTQINKPDNEPRKPYKSYGGISPDDWEDPTKDTTNIPQQLPKPTDEN